MENKDKKIGQIPLANKERYTRGILSSTFSAVWVKDLAVFQVLARCVYFLKSPIYSNRLIMSRHEQLNSV